MNLLTIKKAVLPLSLAVATFLSLPAYSAPQNKIKNINEYFKDYPWMGLILDQVQYGPITLSNVQLNGNKVTIVSPGAIVDASADYIINIEKEKFNFYHLTVGLAGLGAQTCLKHTFNLKQQIGQEKFTLIAPEAPGVYEVRFLFAKGLTCEKAYDKWDNLEEQPNNNTTVGVIIVQ